jgi:hypothetical protein
MRKWTNNLGANPKTSRGPIEPFNDRTELRQEIGKRKLAQYRRDQRMGLTGRQESGQEHGERLLAFAKFYRKEHPNALLSECADAFLAKEPEYIQAFTYGSNGSGKTMLPPVRPEDVLDTLDQFGDVHRHRM